MDQVVEEVEKVKKEFQEIENHLSENIKSIQEYGKANKVLSSPEEVEQQSKDSLPRLNGLAQDGLNLLQSLHFKLDLLAPQLPSDDRVQQAQDLANSWEKQIKRCPLDNSLNVLCICVIYQILGVPFGI